MYNANPGKSCRHAHFFLREELQKTAVHCRHEVMVHNPAHELFSIGHFLCRVTPIRPNI